VFLDASLPGYELGSRGIELSWQMQNNGKKGIRETFINPLPGYG
jgi:hypothetical protein